MRRMLIGLALALGSACGGAQVANPPTTAARMPTPPGPRNEYPAVIAANARATSRWL